MPRQINILINLIALFVISFLAVDLFYKITVIELNQFSGPRIETVQETVPKSRMQPAVQTYNKIVERNIFGATEEVVEPPPVVETAPVETLEETSLQLTLLGTIAGDSESARAFIMDQRQRSQDIYRVGDSVQNAEIRQILRGKVVLRHGGKDEILTMTEGEAKTGPSAGTGADRAIPGRSGRQVNRVAVAEEEGEIPEAETVQLSQDVLESSMNNLSDLMTQVRVRPYFRRGKPEGIIVSQIQADSIFSQLGLMNGDIIASVNGRQLSTPEEAFQFYSSLKSGENVSIEITRRGQKKVLTYDIQ